MLVRTLEAAKTHFVPTCQLYQISRLNRNKEWEIVGFWGAMNRRELHIHLSRECNWNCAGGKVKIETVLR